VVTSSRGFDGTTIKVAGIGNGRDFGTADVGTKARFKRANDTNELNGIKLSYAEFADEKQDPATALSEVRRLVTQQQIFAIVPDLSAINPGPYLNEQHVPYIGWAFDNTYCSVTPSTSLYGFGYNGCLVPASPPVMPDNYASLFKYVSTKSGKAKPSIVLFSADIQSGKNSARYQATAAEGAGFNVVYAKGSVPLTTSDYSPYVQAWLTADGGKPPDAINCLAQVQCIAAFAAVKAAGYKGVFQEGVGPVDVLLKPFAGAVTVGFYNTEPNAGLTQMQSDFEAVKPGTKLDTPNTAAYFAADMFIQGLKKLGKNITPEALQKALANQTWQIPGLAGPTKYPAASVVSVSSCSNVLEDADGTAWKTVVPFSCSDKTFPIDPKFTG
jgi:ABC-type branched-subunit amino acid transport system substrate-binding protein